MNMIEKREKISTTKGGGAAVLEVEGDHGARGGRQRRLLVGLATVEARRRQITHRL